MAPWPAKIMKQFSTIPYPDENDFYAPYNTLLNTLSPPDSDYTIVPQSYSTLGSHDEVYFRVRFEVHLEDKPVFFMEIERPQSIASIIDCRDADIWMRKRIGDLAPSCPLDTFNGVSAFGTHLAFYSYDKQTHILPIHISDDHVQLFDTAPLDHWDGDILEDEGGQRFHDLVAEIKTKCDLLYEKC